MKCGSSHVMGTTFENKYTKFTAGEAERITGVSTTTQRDWRRRKYLPSGRDGWTQYESRDLAQLLVMRALQSRGIGPSLSSDIAFAAASRILFFALSCGDAVEDHTAGKFDRLKKKIPQGAIFVGWSASPGEPSRYFIVWANGVMSFTNDIQQSFGGSSQDERYQEAIIVLDLEALGSLIVKRAGRPLVVIETADDDAAQEDA